MNVPEYKEKERLPPPEFEGDYNFLSRTNDVVQAVTGRFEAKFTEWGDIWQLIEDIKKQKGNVPGVYMFAYNCEWKGVPNARDHTG